MDGSGSSPAAVSRCSTRATSARDDTPSRVRIEGAVADDIRLRADPGLRLPARSTRLEIEYTALNLTSPLKQHFRYQLEGFDAGWIEAGTRRQAFYTNLPPRRYRFRVMSGDGDGTWTQSGAVWEFSIKPMFYQTAWFMVVCAAATVLAIGGAWRLHVRQVRRQFALLIGERARLSREIHDTLLQSLVGVALQFDAMANDSDGTSDSRKERFVRMRKQVEEYIREARQSIWDLRSPTLKGQDLIAALREAGERATNGNGVGFALDVRGTPRRYPARTEEQILRIGQEAIVNAIRHAHAGQVSVELDFADASLRLRVSDDGSGVRSGSDRLERERALRADQHARARRGRRWNADRAECRRTRHPRRGQRADGVSCVREGRT